MHRLSFLLVVVVALLFLAAPAALAQEPTAADYLAFWRDYFVGQWTSKVVTGEPTGPYADGVEGTWTCEQSPTKACMLFVGTAKGQPDHHAIAGYDPRSKTWKEVYFMVHGAHLILHYSVPSADLSGDPVGKVIKGKGTLIYADGRIEKSDVQTTVVSRDKNEFLVSNRRIGDEKRPDLKFVHERKKP